MSIEIMPAPADMHRDEVERQLAIESNKINMMERHSNGMRVILYLMLRESILTIWCHDERTNTAAEFPVEPSEAMMWFEHAFAHKDANLKKYEQRQNGATNE